ncbi:DNA methyltransferase [Methylotuvimicrobium sp. KM2]|uniref:site-specific DNA-methyltransferase n=1 Tax=Methylotuvimicrobium sp. KM2 TaxID=3133976 RepID=UPI003100CFF5
MKALLPRYAGKVDCIFIDPPYNTGNENWCYNDNVNSPIMREWLNSNPVNKEDMLRHDKWMSMMWPRLKLLHELLAETGSFWMTLDDNEVHRARMMLDEVFGEENFIAEIIWKSRKSEDSRALHGVSIDHEYLLCYAKENSFRVRGIDIDEEKFSNPDNDPRGAWRSADMTGLANIEQRPNLHFQITNPESGITYPSPERGWRFDRAGIAKRIEEKRIIWPSSVDGRPRQKLYLEELKNNTKNWSSIIDDISTGDGSREIEQIFGKRYFDFPKPSSFIQRIVEQSCQFDSTVLDSFAGSATTAHAVLAQNAKDGGNRQFILVECEDYADSLTAERVRRVINGYEFQGTQKEELYREKINWSNFSKEGPHHKIMQHVQSIDNLDGLRFDNIKKEIKSGELIVTGQKKITEKVAGLGGGFTFYTLGEPLDIDKILTGETLPDYSALGAWLFHTATGQPLNAEQTDAERWYLGSSSQYHVWLIYRPDLDFLKSPQAALTLSVAENIAQTHKDKSHLVFAAAKYAPNRLLLPLGVEYAPLPFALYRIEKD